MIRISSVFQRPINKYRSWINCWELKYSSKRSIQLWQSEKEIIQEIFHCTATPTTSNARNRGWILLFLFFALWVFLISECLTLHYEKSVQREKVYCKTVKVCVRLYHSVLCDNNRCVNKVSCHSSLSHFYNYNFCSTNDVMIYDHGGIYQWI